MVCLYLRSLIGRNCFALASSLLSSTCRCFSCKLCISPLGGNALFSACRISEGATQGRHLQHVIAS